MARKKTSNPPDLSHLLMPPTPLMQAVEQAVLRRHAGAGAAVPVADQIAVRLAGVITTGMVQAGQRLLEKDISEVLHVSRAPVREALRILEREHLVEFQARRGACVTAPDAEDIADIYVVRIALFQILLQQLMERCPQALEAVFDRHMPQLEQATRQGVVDDHALAGFLMNMDMFRLAEGRLIADLLASISLRVLRFVRLGLAADPSRMDRAMETWRALHRAIARRDVDAVLSTAVRRMELSRDAAARAVPPSD